MKIILDSIELQLEPYQYTQFTQWIAAGCIRKANQKNKYKWAYLIKTDTDLVETEIVFAENSIKAFQCACKPNATLPCEHVWIASIWHIQNIDHKKQPQTKLPKTQDILNYLHPETTKEELLHFLQICFSIHPNLKLWFQLFFPSVLESIQGKLQYDDLLRNFEKPIKSSEIQQIKMTKLQLTALQYMYERSLDLFNRNQILDAFEMASSGLHKSFEWSYQAHHQSNAKSQALSIRLFELMELLIQSIKEPTLREQVFEKSVSLLSKPYYLILHKENNLAILLFSAYREPVFQHQIKKVLIQKLQDEPFHISVAANVFSIFLFCYKNHPPDEILQNISPQYFLQWLNQHTIYKFEGQSRLYKQLLHNIKNEFYIPLFVDSLLDYYIRIDDKENIKFYSHYGLIHCQQLKYVKIYKSFETLELQDIKQILILLKNLPPVHPEFKLELLKELEFLPLLEEEIYTSYSMDTVMKFDHALLKSNSENALLFYIEISKKHLLEYAGTIAYDYIEKIKKHIRKYGSADQEKKYIEKLKSYFPERISLFNPVISNKTI
ncbi:MAG: hypothetical protein M3Q56_02500 [Bacteroidota bacterium]|nr:hypothetical protein [Bacteroidota bacterium]